MCASAPPTRIYHAPNSNQGKLFHYHTDLTGMEREATGKGRASRPAPQKIYQLDFPHPTTYVKSKVKTYDTGRSPRAISPVKMSQATL
jgi:hypothetical protein